MEDIIKNLVRDNSDVEAIGKGIDWIRNLSKELSKHFMIDSNLNVYAGRNHSKNVKITAPNRRNPEAYFNVSANKINFENLKVFTIEEAESVLPVIVDYFNKYFERKGNE